MNMNQINELLVNNNISINDVMKIANRFNNKDLSNEKELRAIIKDLSTLVGKELDEEQENKMINMVKNGDIKM